MRLLEILSRSLLLLPQWKYGITFNKDEIESCRLAHNTIRLWDSISCSSISKHGPSVIVDVGARNFEETKHWLKHWPHTKVEAFDPCLGDSSDPRIKRHVCKLSGVLDFKLPYPCLLKVDCEEDTYKVLKSIGYKLSSFKLIVVEMWNDFDSPVFVNQQFDIWRTMIDYGFNQCRVLTAYDRGQSVPWYDIAFFKASAPR